MNRMDRIESLLVAEISQAILKDLNDPRIGLVTITRAQVSKDLSHARIFVSSMDGAEGAVEALQGSAGFLQSLLGKRLRLKRLPKLSFEADDSLSKLDRINRLIKD